MQNNDRQQAEFALIDENYAAPLTGAAGHDTFSATVQPAAVAFFYSE
jgi:hypothetical protein